MGTRLQVFSVKHISRLLILAAAVTFGGLWGCTMAGPTMGRGQTGGPEDAGGDVGGQFSSGDAQATPEPESEPTFSGWSFGPDCKGVDATEKPGGAGDIQSDGADQGPFEPWTLVVLPDTQNYSAKYPEQLYKQTKWIAKNADTLNIRFVVQVGDMTNNNSPEQWTVASKALKTLWEGGVPFAVAPGNHDYAANSNSRSSRMSQYVPVQMYSGSEEVGFFEAGKTENSWHRFSVGAYEYLVLALEFGPRDQVVEWARSVVRDHPGAMTILATHAYLYYDNSRFDWSKKGTAQKWNPHSYPMAELPGGVNDGEELWDALVYENRDAGLVLCGHTLGDGVGHAVGMGKHGNQVHQMLANYQTGTTSAFPEGGAGMMRIIQFTEPRSAMVMTYSTHYDALLTNEQNDFFIRLGITSTDGEEGSGVAE